jgi:hypothetical protein
MPQAMWAATRNATPPNIFRSLTSGVVPSAARMVPLQQELG